MRKWDRVKGNLGESQKEDQKGQGIVKGLLVGGITPSCCKVTASPSHLLLESIGLAHSQDLARSQATLTQC